MQKKKKRPKPKAKTLEQRIHVKCAECSSYRDALSYNIPYHIERQLRSCILFVPLAHCLVDYTNHKCNYN